MIDASVLVKWFKPAGEADVYEASGLRAAFSSGSLSLAAPRFLLLEALNSASRRWKWTGPQLEKFVSELAAAEFDFLEPQIRGVARWTATGLTAYDACYVALAEELDTSVVTADDLILQLAGSHAISLQQAAATLTR